MLLALACVLALADVASAPAASDLAGHAAALATPPNPLATVEQCLTAPNPVDRSAIFAGEMSSTPGTARMSMRIELQERLPADAAFHTVAAPGLGFWRSAAPGVKIWRYIKQVNTLSAPASYRAAIRFRWLNAKGKLIKGVERHTGECVQPAPARPASTATPASAA
jgi:hypothetical protein